MAYPLLDDVDRRLIGALQVDGRASPEKLADARALAGHPAVRAVLATTGAANLRVSVWLPDLDALYEFITSDLAGLDVSGAETVPVGRAVKRPGMQASA